MSPIVFLKLVGALILKCDVFCGHLVEERVTRGREEKNDGRTLMNLDTDMVIWLKSYSTSKATGGHQKDKIVSNIITIQSSWLENQFCWLRKFSQDGSHVVQHSHW